MHARVNRIEASPERIDDAARRFKETIVPLLQGLDGFRGCVALANRSTGTNIAISYWETEEAMRASEDAVRQPRADAADAAEARSEPIVERFEVLVQV
jgi:heme-degrading monooxygenase HmoA